MSSRSRAAGEEVRLPDLLGLDRIPKRAYDGFLADYLVEALRAIFPVESGHRRLTPIRSDAPSGKSISRTGKSRYGLGRHRLVDALARPRTLRRWHVPSRCSRGRARARLSAAPARHSLALLPPGPDAVRRLAVRGT